VNKGKYMTKVLKGTHTNGEAYYLIECIGCGHAHCYDSRWTFNGDLDKPTFTPSYLSKHKHPKGYNNKNPAPKDGWGGGYVEEVCHSFVTNGQIKYLSDCTHELAGQTIDLIDYEFDESQYGE
jgi:hypothetical protein